MRRSMVLREDGLTLELRALLFEHRYQSMH
jgi:hypothetical protein